MTDDLDHCYVCTMPNNIEIHHVFYGRNRKNADKDKCVVPLCKRHHTGIDGVHSKRGKKLDIKLKKQCEEKWLKIYNKEVEDFIERYRINYL